MLFLADWLARPWRRGVVLGVLVLAVAAWQRPAADDNEVVRRLVQGVRTFYQVGRPEKAYLHLDKPWYTAGETVWLAAYVVAADTHRPDTLSRVLHVELLSATNRLVARRQLRLAAGHGAGELALPDTLPAGHYLLRAYTNWMRNAGPDFFYSRRLAVWPAAPAEAAGSGSGKPSTGAARARATAARQLATAAATPPDVQFFAEGGNLVAGTENTVGFKATDQAARGLDVQGQVLDEQNQPVASFRSAHRGMGSFPFTPVAGQHYHAAVAGAGAAGAAAPLSVPLPAVQASGYALHVVTLASGFLVSIAQRGGPGGPVVLLAQVRGTVAYVGQGQVTGTAPFVTRIPKSRFPTGLVQFTLFDGQGTPLAERLAFAQTEAPLRVTLTPDRARYGPRQPVRLRVRVADAAGQPVAAQLSLAVTDAGAGADTGAGIGADTGAGSSAPETIASQLLLSSDLAGYVEDPHYYFQNPTPETAQHLDALLLTQGWRRFAWKTVLAGPPPAPDYGVERDLSLGGQITQPNGKPAPASKITYLQTRPQPIYLSATTDAEGRFLFTGLGGCDSTQLTLQARTARGGRNLVVRLDPGPSRPAQSLPPLPLQTPAPLAEALARRQQQRAAERKFRLDTTRTILLAGVTVRGQKAAPPDTRRIYLAASATVLKMDDLLAARSGATVLQILQGRVAGVSVTGAEPNMQVQIRGISSFSGSSEPLFLLDGVPVTPDAIAFYPASDVESIEVLKGPEAAIFGSRGGAGVIAIYTRQGSPSYSPRSEVAPGVLALQFPGYSCAREFYVPRYDDPQTRRELPDLRRSTLYWNPALRTDATGQTELTFFTADATGSFQLAAEGLSAAGQPALGTSTLHVGQ